MIDLIRHYRAERLPLPLVATVASLLAAAVQVAATRSWLAFVPTAVLAALLFAQLRVIDDIADRRRDAIRHPGRVAVRARSAWPFALLALMLGVVVSGSLVAVDPTRTSLIAYSSMLSILAAFYALRPRRSLLTDHLLLAKYPAIVWIIGSGQAAGTASHWPAGASPVALPLIATYLSACVYEALHDHHSPGATRPALVVGECLLLVLTLTALSLRGHA